MPLALLAVSSLRVLLACVFGLAAVSKFMDPAGTARAVEAFGLPSAFGRPFSLLLPLSEAVLALLLTLDAFYRPGALASGVLLTLFNIAIAANLLRGRKPECNCFGQIHSRPIGPVTLLRNLTLTGLAAVVLLWQPASALPLKEGPSSLSIVSIGVPMALTLVVLLGLLTWLVIRLFREHGRLLLRFDALERHIASSSSAQPGPALPTPILAPSFALPSLDGETISLASLLEGGRSVVLVFSSPFCQSCNELVPAIVSWQHQYKDFLNFAIITEGAHDANQKKFSGHPFKSVLLQERREVADLYGSTLTPTGVWIDPAGKLASTLHAGAQSIAELVAHVTGDPALLPQNVNAEARTARARLLSQAQTPAISAGPGQFAPAFRLVNLDGVELSPLNHQGIHTLLLFWNPICRFCNDMLPDLRVLEQSVFPETARILILSTGSAQQNRDLALRSETLLDPGFAVGKKFGVQGTPSAILLDPENRIISNVATGVPSVRRLMETMLNQATHQLVAEHS